MSTFQRTGAFVSVLFAMAAIPSMAHAAAALASGAKTSARPTSTNPAIHQMQITFDPGAANLNVQSFQLDVGYEKDKVSMVPNSLTFINPFTAVKTGQNDAATGLITGIGGQSTRAQTKPGDVDLFTVTFQMQAGVPDNTPVNFQFGDLTNNPANFVMGIDPDPQITTNDFAYHTAGTGSTQIETISIFAAVTPEPSAGIVALVGLFAATCARCPRQRKSEI